MDRQAKKAIVLGATGLVGRLLTQMLLVDVGYSGVLVFGRNPTGLNHPKLTEVRADLLALEDFKAEFAADVVFCCVGTTKAKTPDKEVYKSVDYGIPVTAARLCEANGIPAYLVVSALGANPESPVFYNRVKGEMEAEVLKSGVPQVQIVQPSLIGGRRVEARRGERIVQRMMYFLDPILIGPMAKYRIIEPEDIAVAMIYLADHPQSADRIPSDHIRKFALEAKKGISGKT